MQASVVMITYHALHISNVSPIMIRAINRKFHIITCIMLVFILIPPKEVGDTGVSPLEKIRNEKNLKVLVHGVVYIF